MSRLKLNGEACFLPFRSLYSRLTEPSMEWRNEVQVQKTCQIKQWSCLWSSGREASLPQWGAFGAEIKDSPVPVLNVPCGRERLNKLLTKHSCVEWARDLHEWINYDEIWLLIIENPNSNELNHLQVWCLVIQRESWGARQRPTFHVSGCASQCTV